MKHFLLFYEATADYATKRAPYRKKHLEHAIAAHRHGDLLLGGAFANPVDGAVIVFQGESSKAAEDFAKADPYVINGAVTSWHVREWTTVVGDNPSVNVDPNMLYETSD